MEKQAVLESLKKLVVEISSKESEWLSYSGVSKRNLEFVRATLEKYIAEIEGDRLPERRSRLSELGRIVTDSWDYSIPIGERILDLENQYRKL